MRELFELAGSSKHLNNGAGAIESSGPASGAGTGEAGEEEVRAAKRIPFLAAAFVRRLRTGVDLYLDDGQLSLLPLSLKIDDSLIRGLSKFFLEGFDVSAASSAGDGTEVPAHLHRWKPTSAPTRVDDRLIELWRQSHS